MSRMIKQITGQILIPPNVKIHIDSLKPYVGGEWDNTEQEIKDFKALVRHDLLKAQNNCCAYCGLPFDETGKIEIEHFAPKGGAKRPKHVEFTFEVENLYLSCNLCNSPIKKGVKDTISVKDPNKYKNCIFNIVHPRYDNPNDHYEWLKTIEAIFIQKKSVKGKESIRLFKLDSTAHTEARARIEMRNRFSYISADKQALIKQILGYS